LFEGLIYLPPEGKDNSFPKAILWSDESIKILVKELPTIAKEWKDSIKDEFMEKGIVMASTSDINIIEQQWQMIGNLIQAKKQQDMKISTLSEEQHAMQRELSDHSKIIEQHDQIIRADKPNDETIKTIRDYIQNLYETRAISIWSELHAVFHFSKLARISEEKGQAIINYIRKKYFN